MHRFSPVFKWQHYGNCVKFIILSDKPFCLNEAVIKNFVVLIKAKLTILYNETKNKKPNQIIPKGFDSCVFRTKETIQFDVGEFVINKHTKFRSRIVSKIG